MTKDWHHRSDGRLIRFLVLGGLVLLSASFFISTWFNAAPGSVPDWIAAVSTLAALLAATYAAVQASRTLRLEQERDVTRDQVARQQQASQVAVWGSKIEHRGPRHSVTMAPGQPNRETVDPGPVYPVSLPVTIRNASPLPVFNLCVELFVVPPDGGTLWAGTFPYPEPVVDEIRGVEIMTPEMVQSVVAVLNRLPGTDQGPSEFRIGWSFEDIAGVRWLRTPGGILADLPSQDG